MVRVKRIKKKIDPKTGKPEAGGTPSFEFVDTETGEVFSSPEATKTSKEFAQIRKLPETQRKEQLLRASRERQGLPGTEQQVEEVREKIGTQPLREELEAKIAEPPSLAPPTRAETREEQVATAEAQREFFGKLFTGKASAEEIKKQAKAAAIAGGVVVGVLALPFAAQFAARSVIGKTVAASSGFVKGIISTILLGAAGGGIATINRGEINTMRKRISGIVEDGEKIEASVKNGLDPIFAIEQLTTMSETIDSSEDALKQLGILNVQYRFGKEFLADMDDIVTARTAILRRVEAIENIVATGQAVLDPQALVMTVSQFE